MISSNLAVIHIFIDYGNIQLDAYLNCLHSEPDKFECGQSENARAFSFSKFSSIFSSSRSPAETEGANI